MKSNFSILCTTVAAGALLAFVGCSKSDDGDKTVPVTSVTITEGVTYSLSMDNTHTFRATVLPDNATDKTVSWSSAPGTTLSIDTKTGAATALAAGTATVTATAGGKTATCTVTIAANVVPVTGITLTPAGPVQLKLDETTTQQLTPTIVPENATNKAVTYTSGYPEVATVSATGLVTGLAGGKTTITATTEDGQHQTQAEVSVFIPLPDDNKWSYPDNDVSKLRYTDDAFQWRKQPLPLLVTFDFEGEKCNEFVVELTFSSAAAAAKYKADMKDKEGYTISLSDKKISIRVSSPSKHPFFGETQLKFATDYNSVIGGASKSIINQLCSVPECWSYSTDNSYVFQYEDHKDFNSKTYPVALWLDFEGTGASCSKAAMKIQFESAEESTVNELVSSLNARFGKTVAIKSTIPNRTLYFLTVETSLIPGDFFKGQSKDAIWQIKSKDVKSVLDNYYKTLVEVKLGSDWGMPDLNSLIYTHNFGGSISSKSWKLTFTYDRFGECTGTELVCKFLPLKDAQDYYNTLNAAATQQAQLQGKTVTVNIKALSNYPFNGLSKRDILLRDVYVFTNGVILK